MWIDRHNVLSWRIPLLIVFIKACMRWQYVYLIGVTDSHVHNRRKQENKIMLKICPDMLYYAIRLRGIFLSQSLLQKHCLHVMCLYLKYPRQCLLEYENILSSPQIRNKLNVFGYVDCIFSLFVRNEVTAGI